MFESSVVDVLVADHDHRRKGRPPKPDRPSASEKKFLPKKIWNKTKFAGIITLFWIK